MKKTFNIGMIGYKFMGKAHSHAYKDLPMFFPQTAVPEMKLICGRDENAVRTSGRAIRLGRLCDGLARAC